MLEVGRGLSETEIGIVNGIEIEKEAETTRRDPIRSICAALPPRRGYLPQQLGCLCFGFEVVEEEDPDMGIYSSDDLEGTEDPTA